MIFSNNLPDMEKATQMFRKLLSKGMCPRECMHEGALGHASAREAVAGCVLLMLQILSRVVKGIT